MGGGGGTVIITSAPGPGLCHSQRFFERFFGDSLRDSLEMDLVRSLTILKFQAMRMSVLVPKASGNCFSDSNIAYFMILGIGLNKVHFTAN